MFKVNITKGLTVYIKTMFDDQVKRIYHTSIYHSVTIPVVMSSVTIYIEEHGPREVQIKKDNPLTNHPLRG